MVITYHGGECFKVAFADTTLAFNPPAKESALKGARFGADIVLVTLNDPDFNGVEQAAFGDKKPFVISGPGEYEAKKVTVRGFGVPVTYKGVERTNTMYTVDLENMHLCFLGALKSRKMEPELRGELGDIDILFVPVGGGDVLNAADAHELSVELEAKLVIPMHYPSTGSGQVAVGEKDALKKFLKEEGVENGKPLDKLTIKKKDLEGKEGEIVVLAQP